MGVGKKEKEKEKKVESMQNKQITINMPLLHFWIVNLLGKVAWYRLQLWMEKTNPRILLQYTE